MAVGHKSQLILLAHNMKAINDAFSAVTGIRTVEERLVSLWVQHTEQKRFQNDHQKLDALPLHTLRLLITSYFFNALDSDLVRWCDFGRTSSSPRCQSGSTQI
eukprot:Blabericola_migrator_1__3824@NODE_2151_length_3198_cov_332_916959_g1360_i0_p3_GENE_NODE_2151_length_3198_cov_332_916959_g1360_i0NODE_2151_length_3198_cov_332_916959_g1360_i0_p3_ORF_typecomplete_len103_score6_08_NODE_2151_length_3198_cov_332_916959_g1360_i0479787